VSQVPQHQSPNLTSCSIWEETVNGSQVPKTSLNSSYLTNLSNCPPGPEITSIPSSTPANCKVDLVASFSRHGSRYPDQGAYNQWTDLSSRIQKAGRLTIKDSKLSFISTWKPVLTDPAAQIAQISSTGYRELYDMGATYRLRYADLYDYNTPFTLWANYYSGSPRVRDSARLFARGFLGPNATDLGTVHALNASAPQSFMNSLAPSDLCPAYADNSGSPYSGTWANIYLPPIVRRLNAQIRGEFNFTQSDVSIIPYLCGFESQITGQKSPWCSLFSTQEILQYEYAQDLRYWYGTGLGTDIEKYLMLPVLSAVVKRFVDGPDAVYADPKTGEGFKPPKVMVGFSNDGQINQLLAMLGVFDKQKSLPATRIATDRLFRSSNLVRMRGTVAFERLSCAAPGHGHSQNSPPSNETYMRILLNDVVYPVVGCQNGPGSSCPLAQYQKLVQKKMGEAGDFKKLCNVTDPAVPEGRKTATFFENPDVDFATVLRP
jgi:acid phosphatase